MTRSSRHRSHKQHYRQSSTDSDDEGSTRYGPELLPDIPEVKKIKEEVSSKGARSGSLKGKQEIQLGDDPGASGSKRKSSKSRELGPGDSLPSKKRRGSVSVSAMSPTPERWDGGEAQGDALSLLAYLDCSKEKDSKADSDSSGRNLGMVDDKPLRNEEKNHHKLKETGYVNNGNAMNDSTDSTHLKNRVSRRKETLDSSSKEQCAELPASKIDSDAFRKASSAKSGLRLKSDKVAGKKELKEHLEEGTSHRDVQRTMEHAKKVCDSKQETAVNAVAGPTRKFDDTGKRGSQNENAQEEVLDKKGQKSTEWRIQDELRNLELEKELENRIRRRREESGERDRWRDDDRDKEGKLYQSRDSSHRDDRYKGGKQKGDKPRDDRYKDERQMDDKPKTERFKDQRQRDEKPREDSHRGVRYREEKYREDRCKDEKIKVDKIREDQVYLERTVDRCERKPSRDESRLREGRHKESRYYDSDEERSSYYDDCQAQNDSYDKSRQRQKLDGIRLQRSQGNKDSPADDNHRGASGGSKEAAFTQERLGSDFRCSNTIDVAAQENRQKRAHDIGSDIGRERKRSSDILTIRAVRVLDSKLERHKGPREGLESKDFSLEERPWLARDKQNTQNFEQLHDHYKDQVIQHNKNRTEKQLGSQRGESPLGSADSSLKSSGHISPVQVAQASPSPSVHDMRHHSSYDKTVQRNKMENENSLSSVSGMRSRRGRSRNYVGTSDSGKPSGPENEIRHRAHGIVCKDNDVRRDRSQSIDRVCNSHFNNSKTDGFSRAPSVYTADSRVSGSQDEVLGLDYHSKLPLSSGFSSISVEVPNTFHHLEEMTSNRSGCSSHFVQNSRTGGTHLRPRGPFPVRPSSHLPPPPPFRPGIDNPAVLSSNSNFEEGPCSREHGRADWKASPPFKRGELNGAVRNWNMRPQGPGPSGSFIPFPHHAGGHSHGGFLNMGQQYAGPPFYRGVRPSADMNHGGVPYHMWDGGDGYPGHSGAFGWHRQAEDVCGSNVQGSLHAWDGPGLLGEEALMYGRRDWYPNRQGMGSGSWDRATGPWKGQASDISTEAWGGSQYPHDHHEKIKRERSPTESIEIKRSDEVTLKVIAESPQVTSSAGARNLNKNARNLNKNASDTIRFYLSKLDISAELAGPDLYSQCASLLGTGQTVGSCNADFSTDVYMEDHQLEVDMEADTLICSLDTRRAFFPNLPENRAVELYKKAKKRFEKITIDTYMNSGLVTRELFGKGFPPSEGCKAEPCHTMENSKSLVDVAVKSVPENTCSYNESIIPTNELPACLDAQNSTKKVREVSKTALESVNDANAMGFRDEPGDDLYGLDFAGTDKFSGGIQSTVKEYALTENMNVRNVVIKGDTDNVDLIGPNNFVTDHVASVDSCTLLVNADVVTCIKPASTTESECDSKELAKKHEGDAESNRLGHACESWTRRDHVELNGMCVRCQDKNKLNVDVCSATAHQEDESMESTEMACGVALKFELADNRSENIECNAEELLKKYGGDAESVSMISDSKILGHACESCPRGLNGELNDMCVRCQGGNHLNMDLCSKTALQQNESLESTERAQGAIQFELVKAKGKNRECQSLYNLPGNTR
eukprot:Gb_40361 [translate_table: standard]